MNNVDSPSIQDSEFKILIIDDDNWIERIICKYVEDWGFQALSASDPIVGLGKAVMQRPTLILLDIYMPEINGYTLLKIFKEIDITKDIPVIIISANLNKEILTASFKHGATAFIAKPISQKVLIEKILTCLDEDINEKMNLKDISKDIAEENATEESEDTIE